jgi:internalin A
MPHAIGHKELKNLTWLNLCCAKVTDAGVKELKNLKKLNTLYLDRTKLTDACLKKL